MKRCNKITFITVQPFPVGMAASNRIIGLSKGLIHEGYQVEINIIRPTEKKGNEINMKMHGNYEGIPFRYLCGTLIWPESKFKRLLLLCYGTLNGCLKILLGSRKVIITTTTNYFINLLLFLITRISRCKLIRTEDEYPIMFITKNHKYSKWYTRFYISTLYKFYDGMIVISNSLHKFYSPLIRKRASIIVVPITVELERFVKGLNLSKRQKIVSYAGYLGGDKDGVDLLIRSFAIFSKSHTHYKLQLIGYTNNEKELADLNTLAKKLHIQDKIIFTGRVLRDKIPDLLSISSILALARPNNLQAQGGIPTKLGEYLATGIPVITTKVGDIPDFISHGVNGFMALPNNIENFAKVLCEIADDQDTAFQIGIEGRNLAKTKFDYKIQGKTVGTFIESII